MTSQPDLSSWPSKAETARLLGIGDRTLDRMIARGSRPELRMRPRSDGRKPEPVCNPDDVQALLSEKNRAVVMPPETSAGALAVRPSSDLQGLARVVEAVGSVARPATVEAPKLWLTLRQAAEYSGLSMALLQRLAHDRQITAVKDNGWKIRRAALDALDRPMGMLADIDAEFAE